MVSHLKGKPYKKMYHCFYVIINSYTLILIKVYNNYYSMKTHNIWLLSIF